MLQLWKIHLHLLSAQNTTNKLRDFRDYSTFSLYSSKKITHQDQLPTSFSFFWLKGQEKSFKSLEFLYFPVKFLLDEKAMNLYCSSIIVYMKLLLQSRSLPVHAKPNLPYIKQTWHAPAFHLCLTSAPFLPLCLDLLFTEFAVIVPVVMSAITGPCHSQHRFSCSFPWDAEIDEEVTNITAGGLWEHCDPSQHPASIEKLQLD